MPTGTAIKLETIWGTRVRDRRKALHLTQRQLAGLVACSQGTIHKIETGVLTPRDSLKVRLAAALGTRPDKLFPWGHQIGSAA